MKKILLVLAVALFTSSILVVSCTAESVEDIETQSPDKDKSNCTGCNQ